MLALNVAHVNGFVSEWLLLGARYAFSECIGRFVSSSSAESACTFTKTWKGGKYCKRYEAEEMFGTVMLFLDVRAPLAGRSLAYSRRDQAVPRIGGDAAGPMPLRRFYGTRWVPVAKSELPARSLAAVAADEEGNLLVHGGAVGNAKELPWVG